MKSFPRSDTQIGKAKQEQAKRLGQSGAFGKRKRCKKGKSCGASCIASYKVCMVDLPWVGQTAMDKIRKAIQRELAKSNQPPITAPKAPPVLPIFEPGVNKPKATANSKPKFKFNELSRQ